MGIEADGARYTAWPPPGGEPWAAVDAGQGVDLPGAVALDGAPGTEHLYLVWCPAPVEPTCASAGAGAPPKCPEGCRMSPFVLKKAAP